MRYLNGPPLQKFNQAKRSRRATDGSGVIGILLAIWKGAGSPGSARLKALLPLWMPWAKKQFALSATMPQQLWAIRPATIDRHLSEKKQILRKNLYGRTKPGTLLKHHIPIKTDCWDVTSQALPKSIWSPILGNAPLESF